MSSLCAEVSNELFVRGLTPNPVKDCNPGGWVKIIADGRHKGCLGQIVAIDGTDKNNMVWINIEGALFWFRADEVAGANTEGCVTLQEQSHEPFNIGDRVTCNPVGYPGIDGHYKGEIATVMNYFGDKYVIKFTESTDESTYAIEHQWLELAPPDVPTIVSADVQGPSTFVKHDTGKPQVSQIDPKFLLDIADVLTLGTEKYGRNNWQQCTDRSRYYDSTYRHWLQYLQGEGVDVESGKSHLVHMACNLMFLHWFDKNEVSRNDKS